MAAGNRKRAGGEAGRRRRDRRGLLLATGGVLALLACAGGVRLLVRPELPQPTAVGGPFRLAAAGGGEQSDQNFRGRYMLIFFGYTGCTDICPQTLTEMSEALDRIDPEARRIQPIFITVDPARDTPDKLQRYAGAFSPHLLALTGTPDAVGEVERRFHVAVQIDPDGHGTDIDHSAVLFLMGTHGEFLAPIPADASRNEMLAALKRFVRTG
jgi:protein SCO1